jgi:sn-glycerol 3-phosphate transport system permease protein
LVPITRATGNVPDQILSVPVRIDHFDALSLHKTGRVCYFPSMAGNVPAKMRAKTSFKLRAREHSARSVRSGVGPWLVAPALVILAVFVYRPLAEGLRLSVYGSDLFGNPTKFVGLRNYVQILGDPGFQRVVVVSLVIALLSMTIAVGGAFLAVVLLRRWIPGHGIFQVIFSLPFAFSAASASAVFSGLLSPSVGIVNQLLSDFGIGPVPWLEQPAMAVVSISITTAWYEAGFAFLVLGAAIRTIPPEVLEAADLDGAGGFRLARSVLAPLMSPSLFFLVVTQTISGLQSFTQIQILTRGGPANATTTLVYDLYQYAFGQGTPDFGRASVVAIILVLIVALITWLQFRFINRRVTA